MSIEDVGANIRQHRTRRGLTLADLTALTGTTSPALSAIETGKVQPTLATLDRIAAALNIEPADLFKEPSMSATPTAGILHIDQVAAELHVDELSARRLLARRRLPFSRLGGEGEYVVMAGSLATYVQGNCPDLAMPARDATGGWFDNNDLEYANKQFLAALVEAARAQMEATPATPDAPVILKIDPAISKVLDRPASEPLGLPVRVRGTPTHAEKFQKYPTWRHIHLVCKLRETAKGQLWESSRQPLASLYDGPLAYSRLTGEAVAALKAGYIPFLSPTQPGRPALGLPPYRLPYSDLLTGTVLNTVLELAF